VHIKSLHIIIIIIITESIRILVPSPAVHHVWRHCSKSVRNKSVTLDLPVAASVIWQIQT